jgi:hypothetical protein
MSKTLTYKNDLYEKNSYLIFTNRWFYEEWVVCKSLEKNLFFDYWKNDMKLNKSIIFWWIPWIEYNPSCIYTKISKAIIQLLSSWPRVWVALDE